jgi:hypothetical protein
MSSRCVALVSSRSLAAALLLPLNFKLPAHASHPTVLASSLYCSACCVIYIVDSKQRDPLSHAASAFRSSHVGAQVVPRPLEGTLGQASCQVKA